MKIAGVAGKKHPTLKRGEAIALSPESKVEAMAREALVKNSPEGYLYVPLASNVIGTVRTIAGRVGLTVPEPAQYMGTCLVKYRTCKLDTDKVFAVKEQKVKVHVKDTKNDKYRLLVLALFSIISSTILLQKITIIGDTTIINIPKVKPNKF